MSDRWNHQTVVVDNVKPVRVFMGGEAAEAEHPAGFKVRVRGAGGTVAHAYRCQVHGLFDARVERADVPDEMPCPVRHEPRQFAMFGADAEEREGIRALHVCGLTAPWAGSFCGQGKSSGECAT